MPLGTREVLKGEAGPGGTFWGDVKVLVLCHPTQQREPQVAQEHLKSG